MSSRNGKILDIYKDSSQQIIIENIKKYIEAYDDEWIAIHEAMQNAIDAIQRSNKDGGTVIIEIWPDIEKIRITDNGRGFPPNLDLLCPGITDKANSGDTKGYQGVGLKALMYSTVEFEIQSTYEPQKKWEFKASNLFKLLDGEEIEYEETNFNLDEKEKTGTSITYRFPRKIVSTFLSDLLEPHYSSDDRKLKGRWTDLFTHISDENKRRQEEISHLFRWYFRSFTYAGDCNNLLEVRVKPEKDGDTKTSVKPVEIELVIYRPEEENGLHQILQDYFQLNDTDSLTISINNKQWDFEETVNYLKNQPRTYSSTAPEIENFSLISEDWRDFQTRLKDRIYIRKLLPDYTKDNFDERYAEYISLLKRRRSSNLDFENKYGTLFPKVLGIYLVIGRTTLFERFGAINRGERFIAANGIPTSHDITIRSTSSTWYLETIHFVVNVDERLNYGKKQIANTRLIGKVRDYFDDSYTKLMQVAKAFVREEDTRRDDGIEITTNFISLPSLNLPGVNLVKEPNDENSLILLFSQLLTHQPLLSMLGINSFDIQIYGLLGKGIYDGKFRWNSEQEPLADDHLQMLEFKVKLSRLVDEFDSAHSAKDFRETDLIIVWKDDLPDSEMTWKVRGVDEQKRRELDRKGIPSYIQFVLEEDHSATYRPIIIVEDWVTNLIDPT